MTKGELEREVARLKAELREKNKIIAELGKMNCKAFKRQHEAERKLNALYESGRFSASAEAM